MKISFGVVDVAYSEDGKSETTYGVARKLEDEYGVMRIFIHAHEKDIGEELCAELSDMLNGPIVPNKIYFNEIDAMFRDYLNKGEWEKITGRKTQASIDRKSQRLIDKKRSAARPSFIDTGLYRKSFRTWVSI